MPEELDIERQGELEKYLRTSGRIGADERIRVGLLAGGVSNRTMLVEREGGETWVVKQALPKLRVAVDWFSDPRRVEREALGLRYLAEMLPARAVPGLVFFDLPKYLLAMEAVGRPHENWKAMLMRGVVERAHVEEFGRLLGTMHRLGHERREEMRRVFDERAFFESLRVEAYYEYTATQVAGASEFIGELVREMRGRRLTVVHGDYSPKNVLVRGRASLRASRDVAGGEKTARTEPRPPGQDERLVLLDHEVIHFGDPGFDLGFSLTHFLSKGHHLAACRARFAKSAREYWRAYLTELGHVPWGDDLEAFAVKHTLGCLLARVAGRSPLEYLSIEEKARQREVVVALMGDPPTTIAALVDSFLGRV